MSAPLTLSEVIQTGIDSAHQNIYVSIPATVQTYYPSTQTVDAQPVVQRPVYDDEGVVSYESLPVVPNVPVAFPRGGGFAFSYPLAQGDTVLLVFSTYAFGVWRSNNQTDQPPGDNRLNSMGYPVAIPGIAATSNALASATSDTMVMGLDNGNAQLALSSSLSTLVNGSSNIQVKGSEINLNTSAVNLGSSPSDYLVLAGLFVAAITNLTTVFNAHVHPTSTGPSGPSTTPMTPPSASSVATTATKAQ